ncbi:hypothetical protein BJX63DRAFT_432001 [Aspergillus granulosus]|uniref:Zn(2)-C6 fungal-type domain-containing protein n=1 Tax=Aspergillus granulosus TaxID=176169 RepID=A0ABR4HF84_9EURO
MPSFPNGNGYRRIKRASRACPRCHTRKVRCDATVTGYPCTNCRLDTSPCQAFTGGRERRKQLSLARAQAIANKSLGQSASCPRQAGDSSTQMRRTQMVQFSSYDYIKLLDTGKGDLHRLPLLERPGCLALPGKLEMDVLVRHYFLYVHLFCPLIDEAVFWRAYKQTREDDKMIPLLLLRAIVVPSTVANRCGYDSLLEARDDLYNRAKFIVTDALDKLPLAVAAYTTTPYILLSINSQSDVKKSQEILVLFTEVNQSLSLRYHLTLRALWLSRLFKEALAGGAQGALEDEDPRNSPYQRSLFKLTLQQYIRLLQYIDDSMSIPHGSVQETEILYAAAAPSTSREHSLHRAPDPSNHELTPVWIEAMENFFFGPGGNVLTLPSCPPVAADLDAPHDTQMDCDNDIFRNNIRLRWVIETGHLPLEA